MIPNPVLSAVTALAIVGLGMMIISILAGGSNKKYMMDIATAGGILFILAMLGILLLLGGK